MTTPTLTHEQRVRMHSDVLIAAGRAFADLMWGHPDNEANWSNDAYCVADARDHAERCTGDGETDEEETAA